ncbi:MAG: hypothetical protein FWE62_00885 [Firmicutes bacterium]|nr:hypothetical protein [Bacillota bacterium]
MRKKLTVLLAALMGLSLMFSVAGCNKDDAGTLLTLSELVAALTGGTNYTVTAKYTEGEYVEDSIFERDADKYHFKSVGEVTEEYYAQKVGGSFRLYIKENGVWTWFAASFGSDDQIIELVYPDILAVLFAANFYTAGGGGSYTFSGANKEYDGMTFDSAVIQINADGAAKLTVTFPEAVFVVDITKIGSTSVTIPNTGLSLASLSELIAAGNFKITVPSNYEFMSPAVLCLDGNKASYDWGGSSISFPQYYQQMPDEMVRYLSWVDYMEPEGWYYSEDSSDAFTDKLFGASSTFSELFTSAKFSGSGGVLTYTGTCDEAYLMEMFGDSFLLYLYFLEGNDEFTMTLTLGTDTATLTLTGIYYQQALEPPYDYEDSPRTLVFSDFGNISLDFTGAQPWPVG